MPGHRGTAATNIDSVPAHRNIYIGTDAEVGYLKFFTQSATKTPGYDIYNNITQSYASMGPAATLALGITECCARFGRGKVSSCDTTSIIRSPTIHIPLPVLPQAISSIKLLISCQGLFLCQSIPWQEPRNQRHLSRRVHFLSRSLLHRPRVDK